MICAFKCTNLHLFGALHSIVTTCWIMLKVMDVQSQLLLVFSLHSDADIHDILA
jgi:hypothetical protein